MLKSPIVSRSRQPTSSLLGWVVAGPLGLLFVFSTISPRSLTQSPNTLSTTKTQHPSNNHRLPRNLGDSQLDNQSVLGEQSTLKIKRFFVVVCGHSGTSLLLRTIGNLPGVRCIQRETALFIKNTEGDPRLKNVLADWDRIARRGNFSSWVEKTPRHVYFLDKMFEMDSSPGNTRALFLHRDGRDVAISFRARGYSWEKAVGRWVEDNKAVLPHLDGGNVLAVEFEELTQSGSVLRTLRRVADFLELQVTDEQLALALMPGVQPHEYQEYCTAYRNDEEKSADLAASLVSVMAGRSTSPLAKPHDDGDENGSNENGSNSHADSASGSKLEQHNEFRTWQMTQAWAEIPKVVNREWSEEERQAFYKNQEAIDLMKRFGYSLENE